MKKLLEKSLAVISVAAVLCLGCLMVGCGQDGASSGSSSSSTSQSASASSSSQAKAGDITVHVSLLEDVAKPEDVDTPLQFSEEQIDVQAPEGSTALEVLKATGREFETNGTDNDTEVIAIGGLENGDAGAGSRWVYAVNGNTMDASPAVYALSDGDQLTWSFVK